MVYYLVQRKNKWHYEDEKIKLKGQIHCMTRKLDFLLVTNKEGCQLYLLKIDNGRLQTHNMFILNSSSSWKIYAEWVDYQHAFYTADSNFGLVNIFTEEILWECNDLAEPPISVIIGANQNYALVSIYPNRLLLVDIKTGVTMKKYIQP